MSKHLARDLESLQRNLLGMAGRVEEAIYSAAKALRDQDVALADQVIAGDEAIDHLENELYEDCLKILALHQPVAVDLRRITATFHVTTDLERMGDLAVEIAERTVALAGSPAPPPADLLRMTDLAAGLVRQALDAFVSGDERLARRVIRLDDEVDRLHAEIIADLIARMRADPAAVEPGLSLFSACRHLERIADHATNIAEDVVYLVEGEIIRHRPESARGG
jgi:phosphate transport system protein